MSEGTMFEHDALSELAREVLEESDESAYAYLVQGWLSSAIEALYDARREAKLTQKEVAERLNTQQPDISRLERDDEGRVTLHRYIEYALACGVLPLNISLRPASTLREYALTDPEAPRTENAYDAWESTALVSGSVTLGIKPRKVPKPRIFTSLGLPLLEEPESKEEPVQGTAEKAPKGTVAGRREDGLGAENIDTQMAA